MIDRAMRVLTAAMNKMRIVFLTKPVAIPRYAAGLLGGALLVGTMSFLVFEVVISPGFVLVKCAGLKTEPPISSDRSQSHNVGSPRDRLRAEALKLEVNDRSLTEDSAANGNSNAQSGIMDNAYLHLHSREWREDREVASKGIDQLRKTDELLNRRLREIMPGLVEFGSRLSESDPDRVHWVAVRAYDGVDRTQLEAYQDISRIDRPLGDAAAAQYKEARNWVDAQLKRLHVIDRAIDRLETRIASEAKPRP
ncbi:MAG: hypothetical protein HOP29_11370 [Phycisphaerales bacterium]|nr:hypothetical protein [Phycisphaerales bacterium]